MPAGDLSLQDGRLVAWCEVCGGSVPVVDMTAYCPRHGALDLPAAKPWRVRDGAA